MVNPVFKIRKCSLYILCTKLLGRLLWNGYGKLGCAELNIKIRFLTIINNVLYTFFFYHHFIFLPKRKNSRFQLYKFFSKQIIFNFFKTGFPFWKILKRLTKPFCRRFKIQNAFQNDRFQKRCPSHLCLH